MTNETKTKHWIYFTNRGGTRHLANFDDVARGPLPRPKTICGRLFTDTLFEGDETLSGMAATCRRCQTIAKKVTR